MSDSVTVSIPKKFVFAGIIGLVAMGAYFLFFFDKAPDALGASNEITEVYAMLSPQAKSLYYKQSEELTKPVADRVVELDQLTIGCFGSSKILGMSTDDTNLGGQCCGILKSEEAYNTQMQALDKFIRENGNIALIPEDPYDLPVEHAQQLTQFDKDIQLNAEQQSIYDSAMEMSHHGGPCCCKCWKWYVMSGLAKKLIVNYGWDEHQIAELWDTSSSCGHDDDTNMFQHYDIKETGHAR
jgi:hypothetical protein